MFSLFKKSPNNQQQQSKSVSSNIMVSPRRKPLSEIFYQQKAAKLPQNFAQSIMELEMQLQFPESYSLQVIMKLNEFYRIAIQHYINDDSRKANHFQRKLTNLLTNPQTLELMDKKALENKNTSQSKEQLAKIKSGGNYNSSLRKELSQFNTQSQVVVKSMLDGAEKKVQRNHRLIQNQLTGQQQKLKMRLQQRSRSKKHRPNY